LLTLAGLLPQTPGLLPKWQLFVAATALFNTIQNYVTLSLTKKIYNTSREPITSLQARTFAAWTLTSAIVRAYGAYHLSDKTIYDMTFLTYLVAFGHFFSEIAVFRTARVPGPVLSSMTVASITLIWMFNQYNFYVER